jgi:hypothetical protein
MASLMAATMSACSRWGMPKEQVLDELIDLYVTFLG